MRQDPDPTSPPPSTTGESPQPAAGEPQQGRRGWLGLLDDLASIGRNEEKEVRAAFFGCAGTVLGAVLTGFGVIAAALLGADQVTDAIRERSMKIDVALPAIQVNLDADARVSSHFTFGDLQVYAKVKQEDLIRIMGLSGIEVDCVEDRDDDDHVVRLEPLFTQEADQYPPAEYRSDGVPTSSKLIAVVAHLLRATAVFQPSSASVLPVSMSLIGHSDRLPLGKAIVYSAEMPEFECATADGPVRMVPGTSIKPGEEALLGCARAGDFLRSIYGLGLRPAVVSVFGEHHTTGKTDGSLRKVSVTLNIRSLYGDYRDIGPDQRVSFCP